MKKHLTPALVLLLTLTTLSAARDKQNDDIQEIPDARIEAIRI